MSAHVSFNSLIELMKIYIMRGLSRILSIFRNEFDIFNKKIIYIRQSEGKILNMSSMRN